MRVPLVAWAAALVVIWLAAASTSNSPFDAGTYVRWDSGHYLGIAAHGYELHRCRPGEVPRPATWCGNTAWFPLYPWTIRALHLVGLPFAWAGVLVAWFFAAAALALLWRLFPLSPLALAFAAFAPGFVYDFAVFPISLFVTSCIVFLAALRAERPGMAAVAGFVGGLTYPIGVIVLPVVAFVVQRRLTLAVLAPLAAFGVILVDQRIEVGRWTAFFDVQRSYGHGFHDPFSTSWNYATVPFRSGAPFSWGMAPFWQVLLVTILVPVVVIYGVRRRASPVLVVFAAAAWLLPLTLANVSVWRSEAALKPIAPLVEQLPRAVVLAFFSAAVVVGVAVARLYFEGGLV